MIVTKRTKFLDLDPVCITPLQRIVNTSDACIVISSSWRIGRNINEFNTNLARFGIKNRVIGKTAVTNGLSRGTEIQMWLDQHPEVQSFVILDDESDIEPLSDHLVQTKIETGLTEQDADKAIQILQKTP